MRLVRVFAAEKQADVATIERLTRELAEARDVLAFFRSVILSGEGWTETCQERFDTAQGE